MTAPLTPAEVRLARVLVALDDYEGGGSDPVLHALARVLTDWGQADRVKGRVVVRARGRDLVARARAEGHIT